MMEEIRLALAIPSLSNEVKQALSLDLMNLLNAGGNSKPVSGDRYNLGQQSHNSANRPHLQLSVPDQGMPSTDGSIQRHAT
jgi:hypothetical protein